MRWLDYLDTRLYLAAEFKWAAGNQEPARARWFSLFPCFSRQGSQVGATLPAPARNTFPMAQIVPEIFAGHSSALLAPGSLFSLH